MLRATDFLRAAQPRGQAAEAFSQGPARAAAQPAEARVPPAIPPQIPRPRNPAIYRDLMKRHDRMGTRHLPGAR